MRTRGSALGLVLLSTPFVAGPGAVLAQDSGRLGVAGSCYDLSVGAWGPRPLRGADTVYIAPPSRVRFDTVRARRSADYFALAVPPGALPSVHRYAMWRPVGGDSVALLWSTGFSGLRMTLGGGPGELRGEAHAFWDFPRDPLTASAVALRVACDAPQLAAAGQRFVLRAVPLEGGDSVAVGAPLGQLRGVADSVRGRSFRVRSRPVGPFAGASFVEFTASSEDTVWRVVVTYPDDADFEALAGRLSSALGQPMIRDTTRLRSSPDVMGVRVWWSNRTTTLTLYRGALVTGGWRTTVMIVDQRVRP